MIISGAKQKYGSDPSARIKIVKSIAIDIASAMYTFVISRINEFGFTGNLMSMEKDATYMVRAFMDASLSASSPSDARHAVLQQITKYCDTAFCAQAFDWNGFIHGRFREHFYGPDVDFTNRITTLNPVWFSKHPYVTNRTEFPNEAYSIADFGSTLSNRYFNSDYFDIVHSQSGKKNSSAYAFTPKMSDNNPSWIFAIASDEKCARKSLRKSLNKLKFVMPTLDNVFSNLEYWEAAWLKVSSYDQLFSNSTDALILIKNRHVLEMTLSAKTLLCVNKSSSVYSKVLSSICAQASVKAQAGGGYFEWEHPGLARIFRLSVLRHDSGIILLRIIQKEYSFQAELQQAINVYGLTLQESRILSCIAKGFGNKQIAEAMRLSPFTIKSYIRTIYSKLRIHSRTQALHKWLAIQGV